MINREDGVGYWRERCRKYEAAFNNPVGWIDGNGLVGQFTSHDTLAVVPAGYTALAKNPFDDGLEADPLPPLYAVGDVLMEEHGDPFGLMGRLPRGSWLTAGWGYDSWVVRARSRLTLPESRPFTQIPIDKQEGE